MIEERTWRAEDVSPPVAPRWLAACVRVINGSLFFVLSKSSRAARKKRLVLQMNFLHRQWLTDVFHLFALRFFAGLSAYGELFSGQSNSGNEIPALHNDRTHYA